MPFIAKKDYTGKHIIYNDFDAVTNGLTPTIDYMVSCLDQTAWRARNIVSNRKMISVEMANNYYYAPLSAYNNSQETYKIISPSTDYNKIYPSTKPLALFFNVSKVLDTVPDNANSIFPLSYNMQVYSPTGSVTLYCGNAITAADFKTLYNDYLVINNIKAYDNSNDGNISDASQRPLLGYTINNPTNNQPTFDYAQNAYFSELYSASGGTQYGDGDILTPIFGTLFSFNYAASIKVRSIIPEIKNFASFASGTQNSNDYVRSKPAKWLCIIKKSDLVKLLNKIGVPFSFDENQVKKNNSKDFSDYVAKGQPENSTGGGDGTGDNSSDDFEIPAPDVTPIANFNKHYAVTKSMLNVFSNYIWTSTFIDDLKLLFNSPAEGIVSCKLFPFSFSAHHFGGLGSSENIKIGNVATTAPALPINSNYNCIFNAGELTFEEYFGSALDYEPYTSTSIWLPYIGFKDVSTNLVMGKTIKITYAIDIATGACNANIWNVTKLLYSFSGKIGIDIPINSSNASTLASNLLINGISGVASLGISAATANPIAAMGAVLSTAKNVAGSQFHITKGGLSSPAAGLYMPQDCYAVITRPIQSRPSTFSATKGFPSNVSALLSSLTGYVECDSVITANLTCTDDEKTQIKQLLESGVYVL